VLLAPELLQLARAKAADMLVMAGEQGVEEVHRTVLLLTVAVEVRADIRVQAEMPNIM
jgi:hypothetical protein